MAVLESVVGAMEFGPPISVDGPRPIRLTASTIEDLEIVTESVSVVCASGDRHTADWTGVRVVDLLEAADVPMDTTHVTVESTDDYKVAVPIGDAVQAILAFLKDGVPIGEANPYGNRFVCPATEGARDIKGVSRIEHTSLSPAEDPESLENLFPEGDRFTANRFEGPDQTQ